MKIALVCSHGGHLTEMMLLKEAYMDHNTFIVTYDSIRTQDLDERTYLLKNIGKNPLLFLYSLYKFLRIYNKEKPNLILSTGSEIAIPAFIAAKLLKIKTFYIESWCRINEPSTSGKIVYPISDYFIVQWPKLLNYYGSKAMYFGGIVS